MVISRKGCIGFTISCGFERSLFTGKGAADSNGKAEFMGIPYLWKVTSREEAIDMDRMNRLKNINIYDKIIVRIEDYENAKQRGLIIRKYE